jgi:hypothetical protein
MGIWKQWQAGRIAVIWRFAMLARVCHSATWVGGFLGFGKVEN